MDYFRVKGLILPAILLFLVDIPTVRAQITPQQKQESCEIFCLECLKSGEKENSFCMNLYRGCCKQNKGTTYGVCGCRREL